MQCWRLAGLPKSTTEPLQRHQNAAARLITGIGPRDHVTPALRGLHWLRVSERKTFKLCVIMHSVHTGHSPVYLSNMAEATADLPSRCRLRSARQSSLYELPILKLKFGERSFSFAGPAARNSLPTFLQEITNTDTFKQYLKTHLFRLSYT